MLNTPTPNSPEFKKELVESYLSDMETMSDQLFPHLFEDAKRTALREEPKLAKQSNFPYLMQATYSYMAILGMNNEGQPIPEDLAIGTQLFLNIARKPGVTLPELITNYRYPARIEYIDNTLTETITEKEAVTILYRVFKGMEAVDEYLHARKQ